MPVFFIKTLYGGGVFDKGNDNFAVVRLLSPADDNNIVVEYSAFDHGIPTDTQGEKPLGISGIRNIFLNLLLRKNGRACRNSPKDGDGSLRCFGKMVYGYGAVLVFAHGDAALCLKLL